jgi:ABC-type cobalamin/Fe3+-siderophores transport system ATPase subunit
MRIVYTGSDEKACDEQLAIPGDVLLLLHSRWDDYGYRTRFPTRCRIGGKELELGAIKILFAGESASHPYLVKRRDKGWSGAFPLDDTAYVSVPEEITFYEQLQSLLSEDQALSVALILRDASYLAHITEDPGTLALIESEGFRYSLQRERGTQQSFSEGWRLLSGKKLGVSNVGFRFRDVKGALSQINLNFDSKSLLPHDVNVIIGPNGVGKSWLFRQIVKAWLQPDVEHPVLGGAQFDPRPNLSQLVAVSYSPFERLPIDTDDETDIKKPLSDKDIYRFFGFRGRARPLPSSRPGRVRTGLEVPRAKAAVSLIHCLSDDMRFSTIKAWANKLTTLHKVISQAIAFDVAAVKLLPEAPINKIVEYDPFDEIEVFELTETNAEGVDVTARYLPIVAGTNSINPQALQTYTDFEAGVTFFKDKQPLVLSSGQQLFFYIVVNIIGAIRRNSMIIVDEPELFLHPTLEIQFVSMLKQILRIYSSKALLATHSVLTVREVPRRCVHVFELTKEGLVIKTPPFETFGGDFQRISTYVFGDRGISKPHEKWLQDLLTSYGGASEVIEALGADVNEEIIIRLHAMEAGKW